jgi:hypothetical protein
MSSVFDFFWDNMAAPMRERCEADGAPMEYTQAVQFLGSKHRLESIDTSPRETIQSNSTRLCSELSGGSILHFGDMLVGVEQSVDLCGRISDRQGQFFISKWRDQSGPTGEGFLLPQLNFPQPVN